MILNRNFKGLRTQFLHLIPASLTLFSPSVPSCDHPLGAPKRLKHDGSDSLKPWYLTVSDSVSYASLLLI